jgi:hypothetical protein
VDKERGRLSEKWVDPESVELIRPEAVQDSDISTADALSASVTLGPEYNADVTAKEWNGKTVASLHPVTSS